MKYRDAKTILISHIPLPSRRIGSWNRLLEYYLEHSAEDIVMVTKHRTKEDWGRFLVWLADDAFPEARRIRLVCENLNTHTLGALYLVLPPEEVRKRAKRFVVHPTPKHASWLNMAEIEISALERQCLDLLL